MSTLERRLDRLEQIADQVTCPHCWYWSMSPVIEDEDGHRDRPDVCPECGHVHTPPEIRVYVGIPVGVP